MKNKYPKRVEELPDGEFFAILKPTSTTVPGDERSRTNPGHGYPEHTVNNWDIEVYHDRETWEAEIRRMSKSTSYHRPDFKAVVMRPVEVSVSVDVKID